MCSGLKTRKYSLQAAPDCFCLSRLQHPGSDNNSIFVGMGAEPARRAGRWVKFNLRSLVTQRFLHLLWSHTYNAGIVGKDEMRYVICDLRYKDFGLQGGDVLHHFNDCMGTA